MVDDKTNQADTHQANERGKQKNDTQRLIENRKKQFENISHFLTPHQVDHGGD